MYEIIRVIACWSTRDQTWVRLKLRPKHVSGGGLAFKREENALDRVYPRVQIANKMI